MTEITEKAISIVAPKFAELEVVENYIAMKEAQIVKLRNGEVLRQESLRPGGLSFHFFLKICNQCKKEERITHWRAGCQDIKMKRH